MDKKELKKYCIPAWKFKLAVIWNAILNSLKIKI